MFLFNFNDTTFVFTLVGSYFPASYFQYKLKFNYNVYIIIMTRNYLNNYDISIKISQMINII